MGTGRWHRVLTCRLTTSDAPYSPRYDLMPVGLFEKLEEGRFFRLAKQTQEFSLKDYAEVVMSQGNSFIHNEERIDWIDQHTRGRWFVELGNPEDSEDAHLVWSFELASDAVLFKLTWHI